MSETTVTCSKCGERVPKKRFCGECAAPLAVVNQPTTTGQDGVTPAQAIDSVSPHTEANNTSIYDNTDAVNEPPTSPPTTCSHAADSPNKGSTITPSYADATRSNLDGGKADQRSSSNNGGPTASTENQFTCVVTSTVPSNAAKVDSGSSKQPKKVQLI